MHTWLDLRNNKLATFYPHIPTNGNEIFSSEILMCKKVKKRETFFFATATKEHFVHEFFLITFKKYLLSNI